MNKLSVTAIILGSGLALAGSVLAGSDPHTGKGKGRMEHLDANKDGKVTLAELVQSKQAWLREVDANKDGVATRAEMDASHQARRAEHVTQRFAKEDTNKDGRISREESHMPARWFAKVDANSDGSLTREELAQHPGRKGGKAGKGGADMDANSDGKIDAAEVKTAAERMLKRLDQNADGTLDASELRRQRRHHDAPSQEGSKGAPAGTQRS
jgi:Ca2+-binding EF-hand superfamily protein